MVLSIPCPEYPGPITVVPLTKESFEPFGTVVENPAATFKLPSEAALPRGAVKANQGTALKYPSISDMVNLYDRAPSGKMARASMNLFVCSPRALAPPGTGESDNLGLFSVNILERHPYTTQTFIPLGLPSAGSDTRYLVIVAPTLPVSKDRAARPPPYPIERPRRRRSLREMLAGSRQPPYPTDGSSTTTSSAKRSHPGSGLPDLTALRAFVASGSQAVTYGAGTWHAPMVVIGEHQVDFVVVQYVNGVGDEDCQEVEIVRRGDRNVCVVAIPKADWRGDGAPVAKL